MNPQKTPETLHHYTNYYGLDGIMRSNSMWCSEAHYLNDSMEIMEGLSILRRVIYNNFGGKIEDLTLNDVIEEVYSKFVYISSFCESGDLLSQWRGYSESSGVSICFDYQCLSSVAERGGSVLRKCIYKENEKATRIIGHVLKFIHQKKDGRLEFESDDSKRSFIDGLLTEVALMKHEGFSEEREWRIIKFGPDEGRKVRVRPALSRSIPFVDIELRVGEGISGESIIKSIMVGPHPHQKLQKKSVQLLAEECGVGLHGVYHSVIPFRQF